MNKSTAIMLKTLFNPGEQICVSPNKLAYHSLDQSELSKPFTLIPPPDSYNKEPLLTTLSQIQTIAINPIVGFRRDENVKAFRNFLVELDDGALAEQFNYIKSLEMPYSLCIFSGSKSLHFGISLDEDLPDEHTYRMFSEWILNIVNKADQKTKNPSRGIRFAGNTRNETGHEMALLKHNERVRFGDLTEWLSRYPDANPVNDMIKDNQQITYTVDGIPEWVIKKLETGDVGSSSGRNNEWFNIFIALSKAGLSLEGMIEWVKEYFTPDRDFTAREWEGIAKKAYKTINRGRR